MFSVKSLLLVSFLLARAQSMVDVVTFVDGCESQDRLSAQAVSPIMAAIASIATCVVAEGPAIVRRLKSKEHTNLRGQRELVWCQRCSVYCGSNPLCYAVCCNSRRRLSETGTAYSNIVVTVSDEEMPEEEMRDRALLDNVAVEDLALELGFAGFVPYTGNCTNNTSVIAECDPGYTVTTYYSA